MTNLTTGKNNDVSELLQDFSDSTVLLSLVAISPRYQKTGLLDEQGDWILSFWKKVLEKLPDIVGCRILWNTIFFAIEHSNSGKTEKVFEHILRQLNTPVLKSICVIMEVGGSVQNKIKALDMMQLETSSDLNFGTVSGIKNRFIDGEKLI